MYLIFQYVEGWIALDFALDGLAIPGTRRSVKLKSWAVFIQLNYSRTRKSKWMKHSWHSLSSKYIKNMYGCVKYIDRQNDAIKR